VWRNVYAIATQKNFVSWTVGKQYFLAQKEPLWITGKESTLGAAARSPKPLWSSGGIRSRNPQWELGQMDSSIHCCRGSLCGAVARNPLLELGRRDNSTTWHREQQQREREDKEEEWPSLALHIRNLTTLILEGEEKVKN